jgi:hypothetical protein
MPHPAAADEGVFAVPHWVPPAAAALAVGLIVVW